MEFLELDYQFYFVEWFGVICQLFEKTPLVALNGTVAALASIGFLGLLRVITEPLVLILWHYVEQCRHLQK
jgi:hypothetical protein